MLNLLINTRPDERFHLQTGEPTFTQTLHWWGRVTTWQNIYTPDGRPARWLSVWIGKLQFYTGTAKCDPTRCWRMWRGELDDGIPPRYTPDRTQYVMTTTPKEMWALRWRTNGPQKANWENMGGS